MIPVVVVRLVVAVLLVGGIVALDRAIAVGSLGHTLSRTVAVEIAF